MTTPIFTSIDHLNGKDILILSPYKKALPKDPKEPSGPLDLWGTTSPFKYRQNNPLEKGPDRLANFPEDSIQVTLGNYFNLYYINAKL